MMLQIIGAGVGGMPYALREAGFFSGMLLMVLVGSCSDYSVRMLIRLGKQANKQYYEQLVQSQFGHAGACHCFKCCKKVAVLLHALLLLLQVTWLSLPPWASSRTVPW